MAKNKKKSLKEEIKAMESKKREEKEVKVVKDVEKKVSFESWFKKRKSQIPAVHKKEIIVADMKARGIGKEATMAEFDAALEKYGVKLK